MTHQVVAKVILTVSTVLSALIIFQRAIIGPRKREVTYGAADVLLVCGILALYAMMWF